MARTATVKRKTKETDIAINLDIDGSGQAAIETGMPFFNHMLDAFTRHGKMKIGGLASRCKNSRKLAGYRQRLLQRLRQYRAFLELDNFMRAPLREAER